MDWYLWWFCAVRCGDCRYNVAWLVKAPLCSCPGCCSAALIYFPLQFGVRQLRDSFPLRFLVQKPLNGRLTICRALTDSLLTVFTFFLVIYRWLPASSVTSNQMLSWCLFKFTAGKWNRFKSSNCCTGWHPLSASRLANLDFLSAAVWRAVKIKRHQTVGALKGAEVADADEAVKNLSAQSTKFREQQLAKAAEWECRVCEFIFDDIYLFFARLWCQEKKKKHCPR